MQLINCSCYNWWFGCI